MRVFLLPGAIIAVGLYVIAFTPDVVTQTVEYAHSHYVGVVLIMLGGMGAIIAATIRDVMR